MEKTKKPVDRQATFDTDARNTVANLKRPVIETKVDNDSIAKDSKGKGTSNDKNVNTHLPKSKAVVTSGSTQGTKGKETDSKSSKANDPNSGKGLTVANSKQDANNSNTSNDKLVKSRTPAVKQSSSNSKPNTDSKAVGKENDRTPRSTVNSKIDTNKPSQSTNTGTKSTSLSKAIAAKQAKKEEQTEQSDKQKSKDTVGVKSVTQNKTQKVETGAKSNPPLHTPRSTEKQSITNKASVLNNLNRKRSKSPVKAPATENTEQHKSKDTVLSKSVNQTKTKEDKHESKGTVQFKSVNLTKVKEDKNESKGTIQSKSVNEIKAKEDKNKSKDTVQSKSVNQTKSKEDINTKTKELNHTPRNPEKQTSQSKASVLNSVNRKRSVSPVKQNSSPRKDNTVKDSETSVLKDSTKQNKDPLPITESKHKPIIQPKLTIEAEVFNSPKRTEDEQNSRDKSPENIFLSNKAPVETKLIPRDIVREDRNETNTAHQQQQLNINEFTINSDQSDRSPRRSSLDTNSPEKGTTPRDTETQIANVNVEETQPLSVRSLNDNQKQTYVLSPSPTKLDSRSRVSRPGRLSPSNESVEPIKLEQRPTTEKSKMDGRESYQQVYAERSTLLKAEHTFRKRIKQLEDEANGFLKAIEELTNENRYLRERVDNMDEEMHVQGRGENMNEEKIHRLEKENAELVDKVNTLKESSTKEPETVESDETRELKEQIVKLQTENQKVNDENTKLRRETEETSKQLNALESEKKSLATSVTAVESEKMDKIRDLNKEHQHLSKQLKEYKVKTKDLERKVDTLEFENKALSETLAQKKSELGEILGVMKDENKFDTEVKDLKNQVLKLGKEKRDIELTKNKEKRVINDNLQETKSALEKLTTEFDELKIKHDQKEKEGKKLKSEINPLKRQVEELKKEVERLTEENERLKKELEEANSKYNNLFGETEHASKDLKEAKDELEKFNKELQTIVSDKESQISKLINQLDSMREERDNEKKILKEEREKLAKETENVNQIQANNRRLEADLKHFVEKLDESKLKEKHLSLQLEDKDFHLSNLEQQVFEMNMKLDNNSKRMSDLDREKRDMEKAKREWDVKKDKIDDIESSNKRLLEENKRLRNQLEMTSFQSNDVRPPHVRVKDDKGIVEAWVNEKVASSNQQAIYVQKDRDRKRVHIVQPSVQKKRMPYSKSSPVKPSKQMGNRKEESKSSKSPSRSLEDLRKVTGARTPESEHSLPELRGGAQLTVGYGGGYGGYSEIHKNRIRAAHKRVY